MSRILAVVVLVAVVFGGIVAVDFAAQDAEPESVDDQELQDDNQDLLASMFSIVEFVPIVLVAGLLLAAMAAVGRAR